MEKEQIKNILTTVIFNLAETFLIFLVGKILGLETNGIIIIMLCFVISRAVFRRALHFKTWYRCLIWSLLILLSLFLILKVDLIVAILFTVFTALIMTGRANINDMYLWGGNKLNAAVYEWVKFNQDNKMLLEYEKKLKETDKRKYYIFVYRFKEFKSYKEISELMELDEQRICDEIKIISHFIEYSIRLNEGE